MEQKDEGHSIQKTINVIVDLPAHSQLSGPLTYAHNENNVSPGSLVRAPLGRKEVTGIVWDGDHSDPAKKQTAEKENTPSTFELKHVAEVFEELAPLSHHWRALVDFTARYYQRSLGEVALQALPPDLRKISRLQLQRKLVRLNNKLVKAAQEKAKNESQMQGEVAAQQGNIPTLTTEQAETFEVICSALKQAFETEETLPVDTSSTSTLPAAFLLQGATGSGKTEVYMRATYEVLQEDEFAQILVLVPEINLTPQLEERYRERFVDISIVSMHSGMTPAQRLESWVLAHTKQARVVLGTRMAIFASMPKLKLIIVDEEHDPSYKQYEGARWSARDLAVWRGRQERIPVILGSATPSLESYLHVQRGHYKLLEMPSRIGAGAMPRVKIVDMQHVQRNALFAPAMIDAIQERINHGQQSLVLLNRRGYAPVLYCPSCGWKSDCPNCSAFRVFHRSDRSLRCHHCSFTQTVPKFCPDCGDPDLQPIGKGTERLEEQLQDLFTRPDGIKATVLRIDADTTRLSGSLSEHLQQVHGGDVDILVGTQMIAKGHDFRRVTLVAAINPDTALFSSDFRSGERLFSLLMQAAGRAGRDQILAQESEFWVQTWQPTHPLFEALKTYNFTAFAQATLAEREVAAMPPFSHLSLMRAEGRTQEAVQAFLKTLHEVGQELLEQLDLLDAIILYPPIPASMQRIANVERGQMLVESTSRKALQQFLYHWQANIHALQVRGIVRWAIDVDPQSV